MLDLERNTLRPAATLFETLQAELAEEAGPEGEKEQEYFDETLDSEALPEVPTTTPSDLMPIGRNELHELRQLSLGQPLPGEREPVLYSSFTLDGEEPSFEQKAFLLSQQKKAHSRLQMLAANPEGDLDWEVVVSIQASGMEGWAFLYPPHNNAPAPTLVGLLNRLKQQNIQYGVDLQQLTQILAEHQYLKLLVVAKGFPPVDGVNGRIIDHIPREKPDELFSEQEDVVDFKNLCNFRQISAGDMICEIVPPVPHQEGIAVNGKPLKARPGRKVVIPKGKNTQLNEEESVLTASVDGQIYFQSGLFHVTQMTTIQQNVDVSTGNVDVIGDVVIYGDVLGGFSVKATGDISVYGSVEDSVLVAGGSIRIQQGMNGNGTGSLRARENIYSKFLENCNAWAGLSVKAESIINCNISSNGKVQALSGKGIIVGGTITACLSVESISIGNMAQNNTKVTLGTTAEFLQDKTMMENSFQAVKQEIEELNKNIAFMARATNPAPQYQELFNALKLKRSTLEARSKMLEGKLQQMTQQQSDFSKCYIRCREVHPVTHITIGGIQKIVKTNMELCYFHLGPNGIEAKPGGAAACSVRPNPSGADAAFDFA